MRIFKSDPALVPFDYSYPITLLGSQPGDLKLFNKKKIYIGKYFWT